FLFISTSSFFNDTDINMPKMKGYNFNIEEYYFLLYSKTTLYFSFDKIREFFSKEKNNKIDMDFSERMQAFEYYPDNFPSIITDEELVKKLFENNIFYLKKIVEFLKQNNIDYQIVFVPYHSLYAAMISEYPVIKETMDNIKRASVEISDKDVYDFFIVNKYTTCDITKNNYMYHDALHPNIIWGMKIFKILHNNEHEKDIFVKINKNNIEKHLAEQTKKTNEYKTKNKELVEYNLELNKKQISVIKEILESRPISFQKAPNTVKQEIKTYERYNDSIEKLIKNGTPPRQGYFENEF
ncbi:MAG: hypothetical protein K6C94_06055, partial [Candidatus Gastranaerophilales bacterium]|nr:hypothetical protein [Candidatus Gastranaerophilales bacterium]